jgi:hypothetical protein
MTKLRCLLALLLVLPAASVGAQDATLTAPVARASEAKYKIKTFNVVAAVGQNVVQVELSVQDASNNEIRSFFVAIPDSAHPSATFAGLVTAMMTIRATETGIDPRKMSFRILGYLFDNGYLPAATLTP